MWLRVAVVIIGLLQLAVACRRGSSKQVPATCSHFDRCAECPVPPLQCAACGRGEVMSSDKQKCLACPGNCQLCRYNNDTKKAECAKCNDGYALSDGHMTCTAVSGCDGSAAVLTTEEGTFGITNAQYQNNMKCGWRIHVEPTQVVQLEFLSFDIEFGEPCTRFDVVKVYEGANDAAPLLGEFCGTSVPPHVTSTNADLFVSFKTDSTHTKNGFNIKHTAMVRVCDSNCTSCADNGAGKCDPGQCHDRFAFDATNKTCEACDPNCNSCSNNGPGKCDSGKCDERYALDATAKICGACDPYCDGCATNGAGKCDSGKCHAFYVHDDVSQTCQPCHPNCGGCATNGAGKCDPGECHDRYILDDVNKTCQPCGENCFNCDVSGAGRCNFDGCDYNYALNTTINTCEACPDNCKRCSYNTAQDQVECDQCISAFVVNNNKTCTACGENCYSCATNGPGTCDPGECDEGYKLFMSSNTCGVCASHCLACTEPHECDPDKCLPGYVFDAAYSTCSPCSANCRKCNNSGEGLCDSGKCATGYTHATANNTCTPCAPNCMVCNRNGPGQCDKGQCSRRYVHNPNTSRCVACPIDCEVCSYSTTRLTTECTECYGPLGVNSEETCSGCSERCHSCIDNGAGKCDPDECHIGYTLGPDYTCKECPPNCVLCHYTNDTTECTQCYGIFGLKDDDKTCEACDPHCDSCAVNGAAKCDTGRCKSPAVFDDVSKTCKPCPRHCASCEYVNNRTECRHCDDLFGIKREDKTCEACDPNCDSCTSSGAGKCDSGQCHRSYVPDVASETCKQCPDHCVRCIYNTSANKPECYECEVSYTLTTGQTCKACNGPLENCNMCSFGEFVCVRCSLPYTMNKTTHECNGATASLLHGGSWLTAYAMTATTIIVLVTGPVM